MLGTLSAAEAAVKRFEKIHFPPNVDNGVDTMCTALDCFVDRSRERILPERELCGNLFDHWSYLVSRTIYLRV